MIAPLCRDGAGGKSIWDILGSYWTYMMYCKEIRKIEIIIDQQAKISISTFAPLISEQWYHCSMENLESQLLMLYKSRINLNDESVR